MNLPENLMYTEEHEWLKVEDNLAIVGITDFAQSQLGDIIYVDLPNIGDKLSSGEPFGEIEAVKTVSELFSPISGKIVAINESILDNPELINNDPYDSGWLIKISKNDHSNFVKLFDAESYKKLIS
tara:strand:- start:670 stop:1047 length:378 start_codon:yes stop_codon:yes gene_type:complete